MKIEMLVISMTISLFSCREASKDKLEEVNGISTYKGRFLLSELKIPNDNKNDCSAMGMSLKEAPEGMIAYEVDVHEVGEKSCYQNASFRLVGGMEPFREDELIVLAKSI